MTDKEFWNMIDTGESVGKVLRFILLIVFFSVTIYPQTKTNLEVFYPLIDSLSDQILNQIPAGQKSVLLNLNLGDSYSVFSSSIKSRFIEKGKEILSMPDELKIPVVDIVFERAEIKYGEMFRGGWFGDHYVQRIASISGDYLQSFSTEGKREFKFSVTDTVIVDEIKDLENDSFPFTKGDIPTEPFISNLAEPVIAIVTAAAVVALFFSIRSK